jgi:ribose transport system substrate-binding protein
MKNIVVVVLIFALVFTMVACTASEQETASTASMTTSGETVSTSPETTEPAEGEGTIKIAFANLADTIEFCQSVKNGIVEECEARGWEIFTMDNALDGTVAIANAKNVVSLGVDFFIEFNPDSTVGEAIMDIINEAGIPTIAIDIPLPGVPYFGASNFNAGKIGGVTLAEIGKEKFGDVIDCLVIVTRPDGGELIVQRQDGYIAGVKTLYPDLSDDQIFILDGKGDVLPSQEAMTSFLTAHPGYTKILVGCANDQNAQGALAALEVSNRGDQAIIISQGCDTSALDNLYLDTENAWRGSVSYAPENYGKYLIPVVEKMLAGEEVADESYVEHFTVTRENVEEIYPR